MRLSKTNYLYSLICPKLLWIASNEKGKIPEQDEFTKNLIDQGKVVEEYARKLYSDGELAVTVDKTSQLLLKRIPIFEAMFQTEYCEARADILVPADNDQWDIVEIKSSTKIKDIFIQDLAFQKFVYTSRNIKINKCYLMFINNEYIRNGDLNLNQLFNKVDKTLEVDVLLNNNFEDKVIEGFKIINASKKLPEVKINTNCLSDNDCPLFEQCFSFLPAGNILDIPRLHKNKAITLLDKSIYKIEDVPNNFKLSDIQQKIVNITKDNKEFIDKKEISNFINNIVWPVYYLDFETISFAIPQFNISSPYQPIPFQFSLHIQSSPSSKLEHHAFLYKGSGDSRPELFSTLKQLLGTAGSIITYNATFEKGAIKQYGEFNPIDKPWTENIISRILDLMIIFSKYHYYNPKQKGSYSIKKVLPALTDKSYTGMVIADGGTASREYYRVNYTNDNKDRDSVFKSLLDYCELDTLAMVKVLEKLTNLS